MRKARAFFFVCAGVMPLVLSYHLGGRGAGAQSGTIAVADCDAHGGRTIHDLRMR